jgi:hypothetical protein
MTQIVPDDFSPDPPRRLRVLASAQSRLAARRQPEPSWWELTNRAGRFLIPASLAAAALAIILLRQTPHAAGTSDLASIDTASALAYEISSDTADLHQMAVEALMPADADSWLLGDHSR